MKGERREVHELTACSGDEEHEEEHERVMGSVRRSVKSVRRRSVKSVRSRERSLRWKEMSMRSMRMRMRDREGVARMFNLLWLVIIYCFYCLVTFFSL